MSLTTNPLLQDWTAPYGVAPFAQVRPEHFAPALTEATRRHREELDAIAANPAPADFDNTLGAFDRAGRLLARVGMAFHNLCSSHTSDALQAVQREMAKPLAAHESAIYMNAPLFARVLAVHERRRTLGLSPEQARLLERVHLDFVRAGALLSPADQQQYAQVMQDLAALNTQFAQNVLHDESHWHLPLKGDADLAGLPDFVRSAALAAGEARGLAGQHVVTLSRSLIVPFLTFSERRDLREVAWRAWTSRGEHAGEHDNRPLIGRILALRERQARLLGYANYADYALVDRMARTPAAVDQLLDDVWARSLRVVERERRMLPRAIREREHVSPTSRCTPWCRPRSTAPRACSGCASRRGRTSRPITKMHAPTRCTTRTARPSASSSRTTSRGRPSAAAPG